MAELKSGSIKTINRDRGFFFIRTNGDGDFFAHRSSLDGLKFDTLFEGQTVVFDVVDSTKGPRAGRVARGDQ